MENKLLTLLENDATLTPEQLSKMLEKEVGDIKKLILDYEKQGVILGYKTLVDWDKTSREYVTAIIEVKTTPQPERGFDRIAEKIYNYPEVKAVYLMSGAYDLSVLIEGKTMKEVAFFVSQKLAPIEAVISTATHFVLHKYKDKGVLYDTSEADERGNI
jgi:DNA-binding Lrp family transcriptional regulator